MLSGKPIWLKDREKEMNLLVGFRTVIETPPTKRPCSAWPPPPSIGHGSTASSSLAVSGFMAITASTSGSSAAS